MRRLALALLLIAATGCASKREPPPTAEVPPPSPPPTTATPAPAPTSVSAPWDTAGSATARAARRNHVYPKGPNELGKKLIDSLPDPAAMVRGAENEDS